MCPMSDPLYDRARGSYQESLRALAARLHELEFLLELREPTDR